MRGSFASRRRRLASLNAPRALIIAPTRELAVQIHRDAEVLGSHTGLTLGLAFGGVDYEKQRHHLEQGVDVLMGTPGRIIDFTKQRVIDLRSVQVLVLDEADRMFDLGFIATSATSCADCRSPSSGSTCCSRRRFRSACWSSPTST